MVEQTKKAQEQKDDTAGLGTLVGITALAAIPFLRPVRNFVRQKLAKETIESQAGTNTPRVVAGEAQVVPQITYSPDKTKINYMVKQKQPQIEPLLNDRPFESKPMFGSALYDAIKTSPADEMLADDWLKFFKTKQNVKYNDGRSASIQMEELFDTNIASVDPQGNLIGGLLAAAKNINAPINKELLLSQVKNNPINKMKLVEFKAPENFQGSIGAIDTQIKNVYDTVRKKYPEALAGDQVSGISDLQKALQMVQGIRLNNAQFSGSNLSDTTLQSLGQIFRDSLKKLNVKGIDPQDKSIFENALKTVNAETEKLVMAARSPYKLQHNSQEVGQYKLPGETNPVEMVWYYPEKIATNRSSSSHFRIPDVKTSGESQPLVHAMYGTRFTPKGEKVLSINEIQADVQQSVFEQVKEEGKKRINPFNKEAQAGLLIKPKEQVKEKINAILKKGMYRTEEEGNQLNKLLQEDTIMRKGLSPEKEISGADYLPMFDTKQYTDYAVKTIARRAAEQGNQYVSVVPVNYISRGKGAIPGNELVYGYANGKGVAKKGEAIVPEAMRKLANQYKTEAKTIQVSKSDPESPFKVVQVKKVKRFDKNPDKFDDAKELEEFKVNHHVAAFKNEQDAKSFLSGYGEGGKIEFIPKDSPELYDLMYALRVTPDMANKPFKLYKHTGGLIEDIFKAPLI
jgi:hypothetical protein